MERKKKKLIYNVVVSLLLIAGLVWVCSHFVHLGSVAYTDNAQVKQLIVPVNSRVQGFIKKIYFDEYQEVRKGDTLALIEDSEFRFRLAQAEADFQNAISGKNAVATTVHTTQNNIAVSDAGLQEAKVRLDNAEREYHRYKNLLAQDAVTKQQYDAVQTDYEASKARYELLLRQRQSTTLAKQEQTHRLEQTDAGIKLAQAALELARLNLSYTVVVAPCDGKLGRRALEEGQFITAGQTITYILPDTQKWIVANYKETQVENLHIGQEVTITVDAISDKEFTGTITAISGATGSKYSLVPTDNSAGNFVKIQQRIPVRIDFTNLSKEDNEKLAAGMMVIVKAEL